MLRHGRPARGARGSASAHGLTAECVAIQCCDTAEHAPRYDQEVCDKAEEAATRRAVARASAQRHGARHSARHGLRHCRCTLRHGHDKAGGGPQYGRAQAATRPTTWPRHGRPGRSVRAARVCWVCTLCTQPNFDSGHCFELLFGSLFTNTVHEVFKK